MMMAWNRLEQTGTMTAWADSASAATVCTPWLLIDLVNWQFG
jgi:hypothetical protein